MRKKDQKNIYKLGIPWWVDMIGYFGVLCFVAAFVVLAQLFI